MKGLNLLDEEQTSWTFKTVGRDFVAKYWGGMKSQQHFFSSDITDFVQNMVNYPTICNSFSSWEGSPLGWFVSWNCQELKRLYSAKGRRRDNLWYNLAKRYENTVSGFPHNILHKLFPKTSDLKLMPMVWKPKQCKNTNFKKLSLRGKKHLEQKTAEVMNSSLAVEKINSIFGFSLL